MRRKLALLLLSLALVCSMLVLVSCGDGEIDIDGTEIVDDDTRSAVSLNFYIITDERTTDEAKQLMQAAFNEVSESKYRTHVEFVFCTEEEYLETLDARFEAIENGDVTPTVEIDTTRGTVEYYVDELGQTKIKFPEIEEGQIDIVLVTGKDMLTEYVDLRRLKNLNEELAGAFKSIRSYINTDLYNAAALDGQWYSVPNNKVLGSYTYLLINKAEAADSYLNPEDFYYNYGMYNRVAYDYERVQNLIEAVMAKNAKNANVDGYLPKIPLLSDFDFPTAEFWNENGSESVFLTPYDANTESGDYISLVNPFNVSKDDDNYGAAKSYLSYLRLMTASKEKGYTSIPEGAHGDLEFAVAVMKGDYALRQKYADDYMVLVLDNPRLVEADMFTSMLAVSSYTKSSERAMEIIADLTESKELRNILQYGAEGTHFTTYEKTLADGSKVTMVERLLNDYIMDLEHTGNAFMAYPCEQDGHSATVWVEGMLQNNEALRSPTFGCSPESIWETVNHALIDSQTALLLYDHIQQLIRDYTITVETDILANVGGNGTTDEYRQVLEEVLYKIMYNKYASYPGQSQDEDVVDSVKLLVAETVAQIIAGIEKQAAVTAEGVIKDAREHSAEYVAAVQECTTVAELEVALAAIYEDMQTVSVFSNGDGKNGTAINFFINSYNMKIPEYTLAGALRQWWFTNFNSN